MIPSQFTGICHALFVLICAIQLTVTSASQCICDTDPIQTAYCKRRYSFKGIILEVKDDLIPAERSKREAEDMPTDSSSVELGDVEQLLPPMDLINTNVVEYRIRIDSIFGGVEQALLKQELTMYSTVRDRLCGNPSFKAGYGYLFQVDDLVWLDPCEKIVRYKDVPKSERHGLHKLYRFTCKVTE